MSVNDFFNGQSSEPNPRHGTTGANTPQHGGIGVALLQGKGPLYFLIGAAALLALVIILVFALVISQGRNLASPEAAAPTTSSHAPTSGSEQSASAPASETPQFTPETIAEKTACDPTSEDATKLSQFVTQAVSNGAWNSETQDAVTKALKSIDAKCPKSYTVALLGALTDSEMAPQLNALAADGTWITPAKPLPENAVNVASFTSPAKNIHCALSSDNVRCSINVYNYPSTPASCEGKTQTYTLNQKGELERGCATAVSSANIVDYGTNVAANGFGCTVAKDGVTCWHALTGKGFTLKRASENLF
ncbi:hypothetical protein J2S49_001151 [Arcanobacterium wilhelmae]|uniref:Uncharacterized protein n=1 Tax=Arcanobacterium wilhelmae TaxID=1803177 RepID=A0ABT9NC54_9ACTO|nr:hypothetical protein [Arcanobacterium wilhelmae]MDP9801075.1 hypothetical protein [Arcanobacterium wilhelmae]WFN90431.1 hypothetical protein P8A24_00785 [Arcanobacterium wilhelmae]